MNRRQPVILGAFCIMIAAFLWSTDVFFRYSLLEKISPIPLVFLEHLIILLVLSPLFLSSLIPLFRHGGEYVAALLFIGVGGSAIGTVAFTYAFGKLNPAIPIVLQKLQPFVAILGAEFILKEKHPKYFYPLAGVALVGAVLLSEPYLGSFINCMTHLPQCVFATTQPPVISDDIQSGVAILSALIAVLCWGLSTVYGRKVALKISPRDITFLRVFFGFLTLFLWMLWLGAGPDFYLFVEDMVRQPVIAGKLLYMALVVGLIALVFYYQGMKRVPAKLATVLELFYPVFALGLSYLYLNQHINWIQIVGIGLIIVSSVLCTVRGFT